MRHNDPRGSLSFLLAISTVLLVFFLADHVGSDTISNNPNEIDVNKDAPFGQTCHDCLTLPNMGWCGVVDWNGFCLEGTPQGPRHLPCWYYWSYHLCPPSNSTYIYFVEMNTTDNNISSTTSPLPCFSSYNCNVSSDVYTLSGGQNWTFPFSNPVEDGWGVTNAMVIGSIAFCTKNKSNIELSFQIDSGEKTNWTSPLIDMNDTCYDNQVNFEIVYMSFNSDGVWWQDYEPGDTLRNFYIENNSGPDTILAVYELYILIMSRIVNPLVQSSSPSIAMYCTDCDNPVVTVIAENYGRSQSMHYLCLFNQSDSSVEVPAILLNSTAYECEVPLNNSKSGLSPPLLGRPSILQYQMIPHGYMGPTLIFFLTVYQLPLLEWSNPVVGDFDGGTKVSIFGKGFFSSESLVVRLGDHVIPAEFVSDTEVRFVTFPLDTNDTTTNVTLCVSMDGGKVYTKCLSFNYINPTQALIWLLWTLGGVAALLLIGAVIAVCRSKCAKTAAASTPLLTTKTEKLPVVVEMGNKGGEHDPIIAKESKPLFEKKMKEIFGKSKEKYKYDDWEDYNDDEQ